MQSNVTKLEGFIGYAIGLLIIAILTVVEKIINKK
jgi:hypothetical protein